MKVIGKKISAFFLAMLVVMSMGMIVSAGALVGSIKINAKDGQSLMGKDFSYYRILNASVALSGEDSQPKISYTLNPVFENILKTVTEKEEEEEILAYIQALTEEAKVREFADEVRLAIRQAVEDGTIGVGDYGTITAQQDDFVLIDELPFGYYLVDETNQTGGAASLCMLDTAMSDTEITIKSDYPSVEKKVFDEEYKNAEATEIYGEGFNDAADYHIGDEIPFAFYSKVPDITGYKKYEMTFYDEMSDGLSFIYNSKADIRITIGDIVLQDNQFDVSTDVVGATFSVTIPNLMTIAGIQTGDEIEISYKAELNEDAVIGIVGNPNEVWLSYSSNPYSTTDKKETPRDKVVVFTFGVNVNKVDGESENADTKLADAEFKLYQVWGNNPENRTEVKVKEIVAGAKYVTGGEGDVIKSNGTDEILISGLDSGTYLLEEIEAPDGYNKLKEPIRILIQAEYEEEIRQIWTGATTEILTNIAAQVGEVNTTVEAGVVKVEVKNFSGKELPSTGGVGTVLFTAGGTVLMAGAAAMFLRMRKKERD
ncbi:SpaH/EbpB family LPXTG-anchored major pilin [Scatolibacter rhodanostii]|uniref:SpaH/EbpB family LPXTG-anchored major pilin n=1 Tax=Scatolibacter rhodanostii TaxID=2014781 RepID=UPI000C0859AB|nr:SpaH/EbpB family LPXTG-anchored major pilin [Scatolibacter rhodanostii]